MRTISDFCDKVLIKCTRSVAVLFARFSLFVVFFWFGLLKVVEQSPASPLVSDLLERTMPFISFDTFIVAFGVFEMFIGLIFLLPRFTRTSMALLAFHMITTFMPLVLVPEATWQSAFIPTLEGQYIIKNLLIIATAMAIVSHMHLPHHEQSKI